MNDTMTKDKLLNTMHESRGEWDALLAEVGEGRMQQPGVEGDWFQVFIGGILLGAVIFNNFIRTRAALR